MPVALAAEKLAKSKIQGILERPGFMPAVIVSHLASQEKLNQLNPKDLNLFIHFPEIMRNLWLADKPNMELVNRSDNELILRLLLGEIQELIDEHELEGSAGFSPEKTQKEFVDKMIFFGTLAMNGAQEPFGEIRYFSHIQLAKIANSSGVYDKLKALAADVFETNSRRSFQEFIKLSISLMSNFPMEFNLTEVFNTVLEKNRRNYPAEYFQAFDYFTGKELSPEEQIFKYFHSIKCLKFLRYHPEGNLIDQHFIFKEMIHQFRSSDEAFRQLQEDVKRKIVKNPEGQTETEMVAGVGYAVSVSKSGLSVASSPN